LLRRLGSPQSPEFIYAKIWCKSGKPDEENNTVREISFPLMPPHVLLDYLFTNHRARFDDLLFGEAFNEEKLEDFWRTVTELRDPRLKNHPMVHREGWSKRAIPIAIHGDAVASVGVGQTGTKAYDAYSWQSLLCRAPTKVAKQYWFGIFEDCKIKPDATTDRYTMRDVWRAALWGLHAAYEGVHPNQDVDGHPDARSGQDICGGFFLVPWILKGDLDYFAKGLHLCHYSSNSLCEHCAAFAGDNVDWRWNNFRSDAL
jgi:hypothetical protein